MACCPRSSCYPDAERQFGPKIASRDLDRYRQKGPDASSRLLLTAIADQMRGGDSVLDIGAGVGVLDFELLSKGVTTATLVDASPAYLDAAAREAERRQLTGRVQRVVGDVTGLADSIAAADVVIMHRVICCYSDHASLLRAATKHARRLFVYSYPRDRWHIRAWLSLQNVGRGVSANGFRTFVHSPMAMDALVTRDGFRRVHRARTFVWSIDVYLRV
jgi:2-polyprenyl-3-methyl-5-hydroxy-6-metoxy-1,4-benzoquinol methylase